MRITLSALSSLTVLAATSFALAQGSAASYGQQGNVVAKSNSGMTAGFGLVPSNYANLNRFGSGGRGNAGGGGYDADQRPARPEDDQTSGLWQTKHNILAPGGPYEYKFDLKKGETIMASVSSDAFDPALEIDDAAGKKLAENDDRADGDQEPFLIFRCTADGNYKLKVLSFHSAAGGAFDMKFRRFFAIDSGFGPESHADIHPVLATQGDRPAAPIEGRYVFRITAEKGQYCDLGQLNDGKNGNPVWMQVVRVIGPTGVEANDFMVVPSGSNRIVFLPKESGDYYVEAMTNPAKQVGTAFAEYAGIPIKPSDSVSFELPKGEARVVEMEVKPDLLVHTAVSGNVGATLSAPDPKEDDESVGAGNGYANYGPYAGFMLNVDSDKDAINIFHGSGTARWLIQSGGGSAEKVTLKNEDSVPTWSSGAPIKGSIDIGDARYYLLTSKQSELMNVQAQAEHFQVHLDIFRFNGEVANSLVRRGSHSVDDSLYFPDPKTFLIRVACDGDGGSGDFEIRRDVVDATAYSLGSTQSLKLTGKNFGLYSINLEKGKRYEIITNAYLRTDVLDDDGNFLTTQVVPMDGVEVQYFVPLHSGRHRLWLRGPAGDYKFRLEANIPPVLK